MYPHRIRLRGPWEYELLPAGAAGLPPISGRLSLPCALDNSPLSGFAGRVRFRRRFGLPRRIDDHERVWLTIEGLAGATSVSLNGERMDSRAVDTEFDVTSWLHERNELIVDIESDDKPITLWEEVALEIRCTAFLRKVQVRARISGGVTILEAIGDVISAREETLELYLILDRRTVAYAPIIATPAGGEFRLRARDLEIDWTEAHAARVELVAGAVVYYEYEQVALIAEPGA
jgi:hypothetical protein